MSWLKNIPSEEIDRILARWSLPPPKGLTQSYKSLKDVADWVKEKLGRTQDAEERTRIELEALDWLYDLVRRNIKRGRIFELSEVLNEGYADCLGYAKVLSLLGGQFGLDIGVVDVVIDNGGRHVPHPINIISLSNKRHQLIDFWYGSKNINHQRIGALVKEDGWEIRDIE